MLIFLRRGDAGAKSKMQKFRKGCENSQHKEIFATGKKFRNYAKFRCAKFLNRTIAGVRSEPAEEDKNSQKKTKTVTVFPKKKKLFFSFIYVTHHNLGVR